MADKKMAKKRKLKMVKLIFRKFSVILKLLLREKETLFKVSEYKTINLKKQNLVAKGNKRHATEFIDINERSWRT